MTQVAGPQTAAVPSAVPQDEQLRLATTERELVREFGPLLGEDRVRADLEDVVHHYDDAPVRTFLAVLVEREARARLRSLSAASDR
jgi:hypothetical protein